MADAAGVKASSAPGSGEDRYLDPLTPAERQYVLSVRAPGHRPVSGNWNRRASTFMESSTSPHRSPKRGNRSPSFGESGSRVSGESDVSPVGSFGSSNNRPAMRRTSPRGLESPSRPRSRTFSDDRPPSLSISATSPSDRKNLRISAASAEQPRRPLSKLKGLFQRNTLTDMMRESPSPEKASPQPAGSPGGSPMNLRFASDSSSPLSAPGGQEDGEEDEETVQQPPLSSSEDESSEQILFGSRWE